MTVLRFLRETRAGATALVAVAVTMMALGGAALVTDHIWLVHQRDLLKTSSDAAVMAATMELQKLPASMSDDDVEERLQAVAERYVWLNLVANLPENSPALKIEEGLKKGLDVDLDVDRSLGAVTVVARADMGGTLLAKRFLVNFENDGEIGVNSGAEGSIGATELVLAIDVTGSMSANLAGDSVGASDPTSRISIVKQAAVDLIDILAAHENSTIAVGIVPWNYRVRLNPATRTQWEADGWAVYPAERTYPHPTRGPPGSDRYLPETQSLPARNRLPTACRAWEGCVDMRVVDARLRPSFSTVLPSAEPFVMNFFTDQTTYPETQYASYACQDYTRAESRGRGGEEPLCYDLDSAPPGQNLCHSGDIQPDGPWRVPPQDNCGGSAVMSLNPELGDVRATIGRLQSGGSATYSSAGIAWAIRLLDSSWRDTWGHSVHPMDPSTGVQKVIVLLTDGEDNHFSDAGAHRQEGCTAAKNEGVIIFTIAAMHPSHLGNRLANDLRRCSSQDDDPDGTYFFVNNADPDALREAFADIGTQMISLRRTH